MDYENFKESFTEALQEDLYGKGIEATVAKSHFFFLVKSLFGLTVNSDAFKDMPSIKFHSVFFTSSENRIGETS